jgi:hypothetical protein
MVDMVHRTNREPRDLVVLSSNAEDPPGNTIRALKQRRGLIINRDLEWEHCTSSSPAVFNRICRALREEYGQQTELFQGLHV